MIDLEVFHEGIVNAFQISCRLTRQLIDGRNKLNHLLDAPTVESRNIEIVLDFVEYLGHDIFRIIEQTSPFNAWYFEEWRSPNAFDFQESIYAQFQSVSDELNTGESLSLDTAEASSKPQSPSDISDWIGSSLILIDGSTRFKRCAASMAETQSDLITVGHLISSSYHLGCLHFSLDFVRVVLGVQSSSLSAGLIFDRGRTTYHLINRIEHAIGKQDVEYACKVFDELNEHLMATIPYIPNVFEVFPKMALAPMDIARIDEHLNREYMIANVRRDRASQQLPKENPPQRSVSIPSKDELSPILVDPDKPIVVLKSNGEPYAVDEVAWRILKILAEFPGRTISSPELVKFDVELDGCRADRIIARLPDELKAAIKPGRGKGYRLDITCP
ncbi:hypothetical protein K2Y11_14085 [bacterium]|nr:hypothetical protein [bacterium]